MLSASSAKASRHPSSLLNVIPKEETVVKRLQFIQRRFLSWFWVETEAATSWSSMKRRPSRGRGSARVRKLAPLAPQVQRVRAPPPLLPLPLVAAACVETPTPTAAILSLSSPVPFFPSPALVLEKKIRSRRDR